MYDAKCRPSQGGGGWSNADTCRQGEGVCKGVIFLRTSIMDDPNAQGTSVFASAASNQILCELQLTRLHDRAVIDGWLALHRLV